MKNQFSLPVSSRCEFRRFYEHDFENMRALESEAEVVKFTSMRIPQTPDQTFERLQNNIKLQPSREPFGIWAVEFENQFLGWIMLLDRGLKYLELGYMILPKFWNQGFATEIVQSVIQYAFNKKQIEGISAQTDTDNYGSIKVLEKVGFKKKCTKQVIDKVSNLPCELYEFELLRKESDIEYTK